MVPSQTQRSETATYSTLPIRDEDSTARLNRPERSETGSLAQGRDGRGSISLLAYVATSAR